MPEQWKNQWKLPNCVCPRWEAVEWHRWLFSYAFDCCPMICVYLPLSSSHGLMDLHEIKSSNLEEATFYSTPAGKNFKGQLKQTRISCDECLCMDLLAWWSRSEWFRSHANVLPVIFSACVDPSGACSRIISTRQASLCRYGEGGTEMLCSRTAETRRIGPVFESFHEKINSIIIIIFLFRRRAAWQNEKNKKSSFSNAKWPISVYFFFPLTRLRGKMSTRSSSFTEINWTHLWVVITHVTFNFGRGIHTLSARRRLIMEKLSRRRRSRLVSACGTRLVNNRLSETCAHHCLSGKNLCDVQTVRPTHTSHPITLRLIATGKPAQSCWAQALFLLSFYNCPHSVHQPARRSGKLDWKRSLGGGTLAINTIDLRGDDCWSRLHLDLWNGA